MTVSQRRRPWSRDLKAEKDTGGGRGRGLQQGPCTGAGTGFSTGFLPSFCTPMATASNTLVSPVSLCFSRNSPRWGELKWPTDS